MSYRIVFIFTLFLMFCGTLSHAQKYYVNITYTYNQACGPSCQPARGTFNGVTIAPEITFTSPQATYAIGINRICDPPRPITCPSLTGSGTMPSEYKGSASFSNAYGSGSFTYCYEPDMADIGIVKDASTSELTLTMPIWGYKYEWQASDNGVNFQPLRTVDNGTAPLMSSMITVSPATLASMFGTVAGKNFSFRVTITGCKVRNSLVSEAVTFTAPAPTVTVIGESTPARCYGESTGSVTLRIASAQVDRFYINCTNTIKGNSFVVAEVYRGDYTVQGLNKGTWSFEVVNNSTQAGLGVSATTVSDDVDEPTQVSVGFGASPAANNGYYIRCSGGTGDVTALGIGGVGGYKDFVWNTGAVTPNLTGVVAGTYRVRLRDANDCLSAEASVVVNAPAALYATASSPKTYGGYEVRCHDQANGSASISGSGGITAFPYTYTWSTGASTATVTGLGVGGYTATVTDRNGCTAVGGVTLTAPPAIDFSIDVLQGLACAGDRTAVLEAKPVPSTIIGTATYLWSTGETSSTTSDNEAGTYSVRVSDGQGCSTTKSRTLTDPPGYTVSLASGLDYNGEDIKCHGDFNGKLVSTVRDASNIVTAAQSYQWFKDGLAFADGSGLVSQENLAKGTYRLVITYGAQCHAEAQHILVDPDALVVSTAVTSNYNGQSIRCHNGADGNVRATVTGGTGAYSYLWDNGATTSLVTGLGSGRYTVAVTDVNGCPATGTVTLENPSPVTAAIVDVSDFSGYGVSCATSTNGTMRAVGSGGTGVYTYGWNNGKTTALNNTLGGGLYTVTVSDNNGCTAEARETILVPPTLILGVGAYEDIACNEGSDGVIRLLPGGGVGSYEYTRNNGTSWATNAEFSGLVAGAYEFRVRDGNGCDASVTQTLVQPDALVLTFTDVVPAFCADPRGGATAVVTGGVADYSYSWKNASGIEVGTVARLSNMRGGLYTVTVQDAHACVISNSVGVTSTDGASVTYTTMPALCHDSSDGNAQLTVQGDGPFRIEWPDGQNTLEGRNLKGGNHLVVITDSHDCPVVEQIVVPAPAALALTVASSTAPTCNGDCDGVLTLAAQGGVGAYRYTWNGQDGVTQSNLCQGTYDVVLTDGNGCLLAQKVMLSQPEVLTVNPARIMLATCQDGCDGQLEVLAAGGNGGYTYSWDGGSTGASRTNLCPDDYSVMVTDSRGCLGSAIVTLPNTPPVSVNLGGGVTLCVGQTYTLDAGAGWASVQWKSSTGLSATSQQVQVKESGSYRLEVLDANGCVGQDTFLLETSYDLLQASFMIPKEAVIGDTVVMVDVSWPLPEVVEWDFPLEMKRVSVTEDVVFGQFNAMGTYAVALTARLGECVDYVEKQIAVIGGGASEPGGRLGHEAYVKAFGVYANPNHGAFDVTVELASEDDILLSIWGAQTGAFIGKVSGEGSASYTMHIDLRPLSVGTYLIRLDHARGTSYLRFVVK